MGVWLSTEVLFQRSVSRIVAGSVVLLLAFAGIRAHGGAAEESVRAQLVGTWGLVSRGSQLANGQVVADPGLAEAPMGRLIYDTSGHVAAQLSRRGRTVEMLGEECGKAAATKNRPNTAQTILGYDAYFGTYTLHEKEGYVTHHLESALFPGTWGRTSIAISRLPETS